MPNPEPIAGFGSPASPEAPIELRPAKINDRFIAYFLDALPFSAGYLATLYVMAARLHAAYSQDLIARVGGAWFGAYLLYQFLGNATGATPGKRLMGIRVVRKDGRPLGVAGAFLRALGYALSTPFFNFGFVIGILHPESRALHDLLSGSIVIEPRPKNQSEAGVLFAAAMGVLISMVGGSIYAFLNAPTPADLLAVEKAKQGLQVMAQIEEAYKKGSGTYTASLPDLAGASGDVEQFRSAMGELFEPNLFQLQAGNKRYRISAAAKDRKKTRVVVEGPPPALVP